MPPDIKKLTDEGWELKDVDYLIQSIEDLGKNIEQHSGQVKNAGESVEKAVADMSGKLVKSLQKLSNEKGGSDSAAKAAKIVGLSLDVFSKKQEGIVKQFSKTNAEIKELAKEVVKILNKPKRFKIHVKRNAASGLISEITASEVE